MLIDSISIVIIAKNAEHTINSTLKSIQAFKEVILYLNNSTDRTKEIAKNYTNVTIIEGEFLGFGKTKNLAASYSSNNWVFSLDSDEELPAALIEEINQLELKNEKKLFRLKRKNFFFDKEVRYSGWGKDYLVRLYNKNYHMFNDKIVHEFIPIKQDSLQITLKQSFKHNAVENINQFLQKVIKYSDLASKDKKTCSFLIVIAKAHFAFFKTYILQFGFLDGWRGFLIAVSNFNGKFFRYTKRYINCKYN